MIDTSHPDLSVARQCALLGLTHSTLCYQPAPLSAAELVVRAALDRAYTRWPFYGSRKLTWVL